MSQNNLFLSTNYFDLLRESEEDRDYILAHENELSKDNFDIILGHVDQDIAFLRSKIHEIEKIPEIIESGLTITDSAMIFGAVIGIPIFIGWVGKNPVRNMQTTFQILKALRGAVSMLH